MDRLPNDIVKEIAEAFNVAVPLDMWTLQRLRLVNRAFNAFATSVLFKNFDTFNLGECYEHLASRVDALASSSLRSRIKRLRISISCTIPRYILTQVRFKEDYDEPLFLFMKELEPQLEKLTAALGPEFRFNGVTIDTVVLLTTKSDAMSSYHRTRETEMLCFFDIVNRFLGRDICGQVRDLSLRLCRRDLAYFLFNKLVFAEGEDFDTWLARTTPPVLNENLSRFLNPVENLFVCLPFSDVLATNDHRRLGHLLSQSNVTDLDLRYSTRTHRRMFHSLITDLDVSFKLRHFSISNCKVPDYNALSLTLGYLQSLTKLRVTCVELEQRSRWSDIFSNAFLKSANLVDIRFQALSYHRQRHSWLYNGETEILDNVTKEKYLRPIYTSVESDLASLKALLERIEQRREARGLAMDPWLSIFCKRGDVMFLKLISRTGTQ